MSTITFLYLNDDTGEVTVRDQRISPAVFEHELVPYKVEDRDDLVDRILELFAESSPGDRSLIRQDVKYLESLGDRFVFSSVLTNEYIAASDNLARFQAICEDVLQAHQDLPTRLTTAQLIETILGDADIQQTIAEHDPDDEPWDVAGIAERVEEVFQFSLNRDDAALFQGLLAAFNPPA